MRLRVLAAAGLALVICAPVLAKGSPPRLRLTDAAPATVKGSGFHAGELVRVTLTAGNATKVHRLHATADGTFSTVWPRFTLDLCASWRLAAIGNAGSHAVLRPRPNACPPPPPFE